MPGLYLNGITDCQVKLLVNFGKSVIVFYVTLITFVFHFGFSYLFVIKLDWGIFGTGVAGFLTQVIAIIVVFAYSYRQDVMKETWFMPSLGSITSGVKEYLKIGLPSAAMMCFDWWAFELLMIISGWL